MTDKEKEKKELSRRDFIRTAGIGGVSSLVALSAGLTGNLFGADPTATATPTKTPARPEVPLRDFGKTGVKVPILALGGIIDFTANLLLLKKAYDWGITYWDTANSYNGGQSEEGIGQFFEKFPEARKKIFLVTKGGSRDPKGLDRMLNLSLERMKTDHIDLFFLHGVRNASDFTDEIKAWAEKVKKEGKIRFMGFSTHSNMAKLLQEAPKVGWIEGIMTTYNYRLMHDDEMKKGVDACQKAGIGLTAMKTQGGGAVKTDSEEELKLAGRFVKNGYTPEQAKIKAVWEDERMDSLCSQMNNLTTLTSNIAAAVDKTKLEMSDRGALKVYAKNTCSGYCAGCADICENAVSGDVRIADVMRYMMYYNFYGETERAKQEFAQLPSSMRRNLGRLDYTAAERACPNNIPISKIMAEAEKTLA